MAEFALGLTKTAVEGTLIRVKAAIEEEAKLKVRVQNDLVFITCEFEMMQSFLNVTNAAERVKNQVVRTWVRQLRDLAFDVEDCVDFVLHLDNKSAWWWRVVPSCIAPPLPLDEAVAEIKQLKARVEDVSQRNTRYSLIGSNDSGSSSNYKLPVVAAASSTAFHILNKVWEDAGRRRKGMGDLQRLITSEGSGLGVVSVWGSSITGEADLGGGSTSLIRKAYGDPEICQEFKSRAWVKLMRPFNLDEFLNNLLAQFYATSHQANNQVGDDHVDYLWRTTEDSRLIKAKKLMDQVKEQRYLVVLEGVSSIAEWDAIRLYLPDNSKGSRIVVSTMQLGVALLCTGEPYQVAELRRFSHDQHICAFFREGSGRRSDMGELNWQLRRRGTISVWGKGEGKSVLMRKTYEGIVDRAKEFKGVGEFKHHIWFEVPDLFNLTSFAGNILAKCYSEDQVEEIIAVYTMAGPELIQGCCKFLREDHCLVAISGLRYTRDWDLIKTSFLSEPTKGSIVVITEEESVARHCVDHEYRALNVKDLEADAARGLLVKGGHYYGHGPALEANSQTEGALFGYRREKALEWTKSFKLVGRENDVLKLEQRLTHPGVISVWGIASVGKSTLVRNIYYQQMADVREHDMARINDAEEEFSQLKFVTYSWVEVPYPFNLTEFSRRLLMDFHSDDCEAMESTAVGMTEGQDPIQGCHKFLHQDKCFVVIDGLRSTDDWDLIQDAFLSQPTTGCIVVITNDASVATHCVHHEYQVLNIRSLEPDAAHMLFETTPWGSNQDELQLSTLTMKCGGLPKVITSIGKYSGSSTSLMEDLSDNFMGKLETDPGFHNLKGLFSWMQQYFDACSDSLKPCIFYFSVFPAEHSIRRRRLLRRWIAEGYSRDTSAGSTAEEKAEVLFSELVKLSIVQQQPPIISNKVVPCQVNSFFHAYIISRPMEDNLVFSLEGRCSRNSQRAGQHLTIRSSWDRDETVFKSMDLSRLRSLTVFGEWRSFFISSSSSNLRLLRVLDLEDTTDLTDDDLYKMEKLPPRLKFLSLRRCSRVTCLPDSVGELRQLQTLDVRGTSIVTMPECITNLNNLQYVRAGTTEESAASKPSHVSSWWLKLCRRRHLVGVKLSGGIGKLTTLHTLGVVNIRASGGKSFLIGLKKLSQLSKLGVSGIDLHNSKDFFSAISGHGHFESLSVQLNKDNSHGCLDGIPLPLDNLRSLKLYGLTDKLPEWSGQLHKLIKLDLEMATLTENDLKFLGELPQLCIFRVKLLRDGELNFCVLADIEEADSYQKVKVLEIACSCSSGALHVTFGSKTMRKLEQIKFDCSSGSSYYRTGLDYLSELKQVLIKGTNDGTKDEALKTNLQIELGNHPNKPAVKLEL